MYLPIKSPEDKQSVKRYLVAEYVEKDHHCKSSYYAAFKHARALTGRDGQGKLSNYDHAGDWAGACMYMILIDHIGGLFRLSGRTISEDVKDFRAALEVFSTLPKEHIELLRQLRNSFLHKFNLYDIPRDNNLTPCLFTVNNGDELISTFSLVREQFNGQFDHVDISLRKLGDLVEDMHVRILDALEHDELIVCLPDEFDSLEILLDSNTMMYRNINENV